MRKAKWTVTLSLSLGLLFFSSLLTPRILSRIFFILSRLWILILCISDVVDAVGDLAISHNNNNNNRLSFTASCKFCVVCLFAMNVVYNRHHLSSFSPFFDLHSHQDCLIRFFLKENMTAIAEKKKQSRQI